MRINLSNPTLASDSMARVLIQVCPSSEPQLLTSTYYGSRMRKKQKIILATKTRCHKDYWSYLKINYIFWVGFPGGSDGKESACNAGDPSSTPGAGRSPEEGNGYPLQYSCPENSMDRGAWRATVHGVGWRYISTFLFTHSFSKYLLITYYWPVWDGPSSLHGKLQQWTKYNHFSPGVYISEGKMCWFLWAIITN